MDDLLGLTASGATIRRGGLIDDRTGAACIHSWSNDYKLITTFKEDAEAAKKAREQPPEDKSNKYKGFFQSKYKQQQQSRNNFDEDENDGEENDETEGKNFSGRVHRILPINGRSCVDSIMYVSYKESDDDQIEEDEEIQQANAVAAASEATEDADEDKQLNTLFQLTDNEDMFFNNNKGVIVPLPGLFKYEFLAKRNKMDPSQWIVIKLLNEEALSPNLSNIITLLQFVLGLDYNQAVDLLDFGGYDIKNDRLKDPNLVEDFYEKSNLLSQQKDNWNGIHGFRPGYFVLSLSADPCRMPLKAEILADLAKLPQDKRDRQTKKLMASEPVRNTVLEKYLTVVHLLHKAESFPDKPKSIRHLFFGSVPTKLPPLNNSSYEKSEFSPNYNKKPESSSSSSNLFTEALKNNTSTRPVTPSVIFALHPMVTKFFSGLRFKKLCKIYPSYLLLGLTVTEIHKLYDIISGALDYKMEKEKEHKLGSVLNMRIFNMFFSPAMKAHREGMRLDPLNRRFEEYIFVMRPHLFTNIMEPRRLPELSIYHLIYLAKEYSSYNDFNKRLNAVEFLFPVVVYHVVKEAYYSNQHACISFSDVCKSTMRLLNPTYTAPDRWLSQILSKYNFSHPDAVEKFRILNQALMDLTDFDLQLSLRKYDEHVARALSLLCSSRESGNGVGVLVAWNPKTLEPIGPDCPESVFVPEEDEDDVFSTKEIYIFPLDSYLQTESLVIDNYNITSRFIYAKKHKLLPRLMPFYRMALEQKWTKEFCEKVLEQLKGDPQSVRVEKAIAAINQEDSKASETNSVVPIIEEEEDNSDIFQIDPEYESMLFDLMDNFEKKEQIDLIVPQKMELEEVPPPPPPLPDDLSFLDSIVERHLNRQPQASIKLPTVVRVAYSKDGSTPNFDIYIGRKVCTGPWDLPESKWHNPYKVGSQYSIHESLDLYEKRVRSRLDLLHSLNELIGKKLGCWCKIKPEDKCHGDVLVKLVVEFFDGDGSLRWDPITGNLTDEYLKTISDSSSSTDDQTVPLLESTVLDDAKAAAVCLELQSKVYTPSSSLAGKGFGNVDYHTKEELENLSVPVHLKYWCTEQEFAWLCSRETTSMALVNGMGGSGKTSLALEFLQGYHPHQILALFSQNSHLGNAREALIEMCGKEHQPGFMGTIHQFISFHQDSCLNTFEDITKDHESTSSYLAKTKWARDPYKQYPLWRHAEKCMGALCACFDVRILIIDEGGVTNKPEFAEIIDILTKCSKVFTNVIIFGDFMQLPPVGACHPCRDFGLAYGIIKMGETEEHFHRAESRQISRLGLAILDSDLERVKECFEDGDEIPMHMQQQKGLYWHKCDHTSLKNQDPNSPSNPVNVLLKIFSGKGCDMYFKSLVICETDSVRKTMIRALDKWFFTQYFFEMKFPEYDRQVFFTRYGDLRPGAFYTKQIVTYKMKDGLKLDNNKAYVAEVLEGTIIHIDSQSMVTMCSVMFKELCNVIMEVGLKWYSKDISSILTSLQRDTQPTKTSAAVWMLAAKYAQLKNRPSEYNEAIGRFMSAIETGCRQRLLTYVEKQAAAQTLEACELESYLRRRFHRKEVHIMKYGSLSRVQDCGLGFSPLHYNPLLVEPRLKGWDEYLNQCSSDVDEDDEDGEIPQEAIVRTFFVIVCTLSVTNTNYFY